MISRKQKNIAFKTLNYLSLIVVAGFLLTLLGGMIWKGIGALNLSFLLEPSSNFGASGGVFYQIMGSLLMIVFAALIAFPIGVSIAFFISEYTPSPKRKSILSKLLLLLHGIPSIIYGIFGLVVFVNLFNLGVSWISGSIVLGLMMVPTLVFTTYESLSQIDPIYRESGLALGLKKQTISLKILWPLAKGGAVSGLLIGLARVIGETAPIMFIATAFSGAKIPQGLNEPVASLPTHILALSQQATNPNALQNAWGSSLVLMALVLSFSISALIMRNRIRNTIHQ